MKRHVGSTLRSVELPAAPQLATQIPCPEAKVIRDRWLAVWSIALGSFALVFSELIPVGLLADIGSHLHVSIGVAGLMVVMPAVCAAISAPLLAIGAAGVERRWLLRGLSGLVLASDVVAAAAPNFASDAGRKSPARGMHRWVLGVRFRCGDRAGA